MITRRDHLQALIQCIRKAACNGRHDGLGNSVIAIDLYEASAIAAADEIERLQTVNPSDDMLEAKRAGYMEAIAECDELQDDVDRLKEKVEKLEERLRAANGGCTWLSEGDACLCGLCKRDREILRLHKLFDTIKELISSR